MRTKSGVLGTGAGVREADEPQGNFQNAASAVTLKRHMVALIAVLLADTASEYPKVLHRGNQICVQVLNAAGAVEESCRAEGSEERTQLPSAAAADHAFDAPVRKTKARLAPTEPPSITAMYWADTKKNWAL